MTVLLRAPMGVSFMVRGQCKTCGWWAACPEGALWPKCPTCDVVVLPPKTHHDATEGEPRLAYVAFLMPEAEAIKATREFVKAMPL